MQFGMRGNSLEILHNALFLGWTIHVLQLQRFVPVDMLAMMMHFFPLSTQRYSDYNIIDKIYII